MSSDKVKIRRAVEADATGIIEAHRKAIYEKAAAYYDPSVLALWAPDAITEGRLEQLRRQIRNDEWFTLVAEAENIIIGFGQVCSERNILGAVYVQKNPYGLVGKRIAEQLIQYAKGRKAVFLEMDASTNAEDFYRGIGFKVIGYGTHLLERAGVEMACVKMRIDL